MKCCVGKGVVKCRERGSEVKYWEEGGEVKCREGGNKETLLEECI